MYKCAILNNDLYKILNILDNISINFNQISAWVNTPSFIIISCFIIKIIQILVFNSKLIEWLKRICGCATPQKSSQEVIEIDLSDIKIEKPGKKTGVYNPIMLEVNISTGIKYSHQIGNPRSKEIEKAEQNKKYYDENILIQEEFAKKCRQITSKIEARKAEKYDDWSAWNYKKPSENDFYSTRPQMSNYINPLKNYK